MGEPAVPTVTAAEAAAVTPASIPNPQPAIQPLPQQAFHQPCFQHCFRHSNRPQEPNLRHLNRPQPQEPSFQHSPRPAMPCPALPPVHLPVALPQPVHAQPVKLMTIKPCQKPTVVQRNQASGTPTIRQ